MTPHRNDNRFEIGGAWLSVLLLWLAGVTAAMQFAKMSIGFQAFQVDLGVEPATVSALMAACGFFGLLFGLAGASITAALGLRLTLLVALIVAATISLVQATAPAVELFYLTRLIEGATNLFIVVAAPSLIVACAPARKAAPALALWGTFYGVAFGVSGALGPKLLSMGGTQALLIAHAILAISVAALLATRSISEPEAPSGHRIGFNAAETLRRLWADNRRAVSRKATLVPGFIFLFHASIYLGLLIFVPLMAPSPSIQSMLHVGMPLISITATLAVGHIANAGMTPGSILNFGFPTLVGLVFLLINAPSPLAFGLIGLTLMATSGLMQGSIFILPPRLAQEAGDDALAFGLIAQLGSLGSIIAPIAFELAMRLDLVLEISSLMGFGLLLSLLAACGYAVTRVGLYRGQQARAAIEGRPQ